MGDGLRRGARRWCGGLARLVVPDAETPVASLVVRDISPPTPAGLVIHTLQLPTAAGEGVAVGGALDVGGVADRDTGPQHPRLEDGKVVPFSPPPPRLGDAVATPS